MEVSDSRWQEANEWESEWWGDCTNTVDEERKQEGYATRMGLVPQIDAAGRISYDLGGKSVLDLGGGPVSILLKCTGRGQRRHVVVDPGKYPAWVTARYECKQIKLVEKLAEDYVPGGRFDECWMYNVLQHTRDPEKVIETAMKYADRIRIFEWVNTAANIGHPHELRRQDLDLWLGGKGVIEQILGEAGLDGTAYYGVFKTDSAPAEPRVLNRLSED